MKKNLFITIVIALVSSLSVFLIGSYLMGEFENKKVASVELTDEYAVVSGVIRNEGNGWELIQDDSHETIGIIDVSEDSEKIIIKYDEFSKVNSLIATPDETMASEGYVVGASVGVSETWISVYDKNGELVKPIDYINNSGNIWIQGVFKK